MTSRIYKFELGSKIDDNLVASWKRWERYKSNADSWVAYLRTLPDIEHATYCDNDETTVLTFTSKLAISIFLLRWG